MLHLSDRFSDRDPVSVDSSEPTSTSEVQVGSGHEISDLVRSVVDAAPPLSFEQSSRLKTLVQRVKS